MYQYELSIEHKSETKIGRTYNYLKTFVRIYISQAIDEPIRIVDILSRESMNSDLIKW